MSISLFKFLYKYFFIICYYIFKLISPIINIRLLEIETRAIGHLSEPLEIFILEKKRGFIKKNFFDIYFGQNEVANEFLWSKWKEILNLYFNDKIKRKFFGPIFRIALAKKDKNMLIPFRYFEPENKKYYNQTFDINDVLKNEKPRTFFSKEEEKNALNILKKFNIKENDKIILLCNRDPIYRYFKKLNYENFIKNNKSVEMDIPNYGHRDQYINDYDLGVKFLCDHNYKVIRMGRNMHERLKLKHDNFFDYAFSEIKSDMMDIYLHKICKFVISSQTGIESPATLFRKKIFFVNYNEFFLFHNYNYSTVFPKKFFYKQNEEELDICDIYKELSHNNFVPDYDKLGIRYKNLERSEIKLAFTEIVKNYENGIDAETIKLNDALKKKLYEKTGLKYNFFFNKQYLKLYY